MRLRRARSLVVTFAGPTPVLRNFLTPVAIPADSFAVDLLGRAEDWQAPEALQALYPNVQPPVLASYLQGLSEHGCLVVEGSAAAVLDAQYERSWAWDATAGLYHFGIQDPPWLDEDQATQWMQHVSAAKPPMPLLTTNEGMETVVALERPELDQGVLSVMTRRRSVRSYRTEPVALETLRDCLFAGLGVTGFLDTRLPGEEPRVPLKMAPSGGGRNPYEGYVYARSVRDLEPGIYHYSALDNTLGLVTDSLPPTSRLFAGQSWTEGAAFGILLVANFHRTMWKYPHPNAYRVVLMEAGHIAQNVALVAAERALSATPTAAVNDSAARELLGLDRVSQALVHAVFVGHPDPEAFERQNFIPHEP